MTYPSQVVPPDSELLARWRDASLAQVWRHPGDWFNGAVEAIVEALEAGDCPIAAARRLGAVRAEAGSDMAETLDDVLCLFDVIGLPAPGEVVREVALGWVQATSGTAVARACTDPTTGMRTPAYLVARIEELYDAPPGMRCVDQWCLLLADIGTDGVPPLSRLRVGALAGSRLGGVFGVRHPMAQVRPGLFAVLIPRGPQLPRILMLTRQSLSALAELLPPDVVRAPPRLWIERLPDDAAQVTGLLDSLRS